MIIYVITQRLIFDDGDASEWATLYAVTTRDEAEKDIQKFKDKEQNKNSLYTHEYAIEETTLYLK